MNWLNSHLSAILGITTLVSECLSFTPIGGLVRGVAGVIGVIASAVAGKK